MLRPDVNAIGMKQVVDDGHIVAKWMVCVYQYVYVHAQHRMHLEL